MKDRIPLSYRGHLIWLDITAYLFLLDRGLIDMKPDDRDRNFWTDNERSRVAKSLEKQEADFWADNARDRNSLAQRIQDYNDTRAAELRLQRLVSVIAWITVGAFVVIAIWMVNQ